jgi:hypothetical protein
VELAYLLRPDVRNPRPQLEQGYGRSSLSESGIVGGVELTVITDSTGGGKLGRDCSLRRPVLQPVAEAGEVAKTVRWLSFVLSARAFGWTLAEKLMSSTVPTLSIHGRLPLSEGRSIAVFFGVLSV